MATPAPAAEVTTGHWLTDPVAASEASNVLTGQLFEAAQGLPWYAYVLGAVGVALPVVRQFLPGIWGTVLDTGWKLLSRNVDVKQDKAAHAIRHPIDRVLKEVEANPTAMDLLRSHLPADRVDDLDLVLRVLRELRDSGPQQ